MAFRLVQAKYDRETERAYVELRDDDEDGGEILAVAERAIGLALFRVEELAHIGRVRALPLPPSLIQFADLGDVLSRTQATPTRRISAA